MPLFRRSPAASSTQLVTDTAQDDAEVAKVRDDLAAGGEWEVAADLLDDTLEIPDRRALAADTFANLAVEAAPWLDAWLTEEPGDPGGLLVGAFATISRAWDVRGGGRASAVGEDSFAAFFRILDEALPRCHAAARAADDDPTPWVAMLWLAIGRQEPREVFEDRWAELVDRDPANRAGWNAGLQYNTDKWYGSHEQMYAFARSAPPAPWAVVLPLQAHIEHQLQEGSTVQFWQQPQVAAEVDAALAWAHTRPTHPHALHDLSVVGYCLARAERWADAADLFALTGGRAYKYPWYYLGDPAKGFADAHRTAQKKGRKG